MTIRVGLGVDLHALSDDPARPLVLGGVVIEGARGLAGHSDADVVAHAVADACLGAAGLGDIGTLFPATADEWKDADSIGLLSEVITRVRAAGWGVTNVDATIIAASPRLAGYVDAMKACLSATVGATVTVKPKDPEGTATDQGITCHAVVLLQRRES